MSQPDSSFQQTIDQRRAAHAWSCVRHAKSEFKDKAKEYGGQAKKLPVRIMSAGLGQALAFILAKAGDPESKDHKRHLRDLFNDLTDWVIKKRPMKDAKHCDHLLKSIVEGDSDFLRRATMETLAYLRWLNRFADAEGLNDEGGATT
jgi:CRISPR-associated protein Cmr5